MKFVKETINYNKLIYVLHKNIIKMIIIYYHFIQNFLNVDHYKIYVRNH